jgi:hypothetical protein
MEDLERPDMPVLLASGVLAHTEAELADELFSGITVRNETDCIKAFGVKGVG